MNEANLVTNNSPRPAGPTPDEEDTYDLKHVVAYAGLTVPVLWLSLFEEDDLKWFESIDGNVLSPVTTLRKARLRWRRRRVRLEEKFPHNRLEIEGWEQAITRLKTRYIKIDVEELWAMGEEEEFESDLRSGIRWFESGKDKDFDHLINLLWARGGYDPAAKAFTAGTAGKAGFFLYGHPLRLPPLKDD